MNLKFEPIRVAKVKNSERNRRYTKNSKIKIKSFISL